MQIILSKGYVALVSPEDFERVNAFKWTASEESLRNKKTMKVYAIRRPTDPVTKKRVKIRMHRFILGVPTGHDDTRVVDHLDHDGLNNRRENLEIITQEENMRRSPGWVKKKSEEPSL